MTQIKDGLSVAGDIDGQNITARTRFLLGAGRVPIISGTGAPSAALGGVGYLYIRKDGGGAGSTHLYFKSGASTWTAIA